MSTYETIADLPLEERHAIVRSWLETLTTIYEKTAAERDALRAICKAMLDYWESDPSGFAECEPGCDCLVDQLRAALQRGEP